MRLTEKEIESVSNLEAYERYKYFIKRVADTELLYTLIDSDNKFVLAEVESQILFSVWSAPEFALLNATGEWTSCLVHEITLENFEEEIIDQIAAGGWLINVFSIKGKSGFVVDFNEFARDLSEELRKYE